jgi:hypothetical protein
MLETHLVGKTTKKRQNFDPSTPPAGAENLHFMLNGETRRAPGPPVACAQTDSLEGFGQGELSSTVVLPQTTLGQNSIAPWTD